MLIQSSSKIVIVSEEIKAMFEYMLRQCHNEDRLTIDRPFENMVTTVITVDKFLKMSVR